MNRTIPPGLVVPPQEQQKAPLKRRDTELQRTRKALELALNRYRFLYEFSPVAYLSLSADTSIQEVNLTGVRLLGVDRKLLLRQRLLRYVVPEDADRCYRFFKQAWTVDSHQSLILTLQRGNGNRIPVQLDCEPVGEEFLPIAMRITLTDISEHVRAEAEIEKLAFYDILTGLPNRRLLFDHGRQAMALAARNGDHGAVLLIDLDDFKTLNDTYGHDVGDQMLQEVARQLSRHVRTEDTVARLGGDEFVVLLQGLGKDQSLAEVEAKAVARKLSAALNTTHTLGKSEHHSSGCIGIALFNSNTESVNEVLKRADLALYRAKAAGCGAVRFYEPEMQAHVAARSMLESDLRRGVLAHDFCLLYQAQVDSQGRLQGAEALLRWQHPTRGLLEPMEFITLAEAKNLIVPLDRFALAKACALLQEWSKDPATAPLVLCLNVSGRQFCQPDFIAHTQEIIYRSGADPYRLMLEITEGAVIEGLKDAAHKMEALKAIGVRFSLDDFGIGYSSLTYLRELPLDGLKIDISFVRSILRSPKDATIAGSIIDLGKRMGMEVIAEGIETEEQRQLLANLGCTAFQGFLFGDPMPADQLILRAGELLARSVPHPISEDVYLGGA